MGSNGIQDILSNFIVVSDWIMDPILHLVERSFGIIDPPSGSTDMSGPLPKTEKSADLDHYFQEWPHFVCRKSNIELERSNVMSELSFYLEKSPVPKSQDSKS